MVNIAAFALVVAAVANAQAVTDSIAPQASAPSGCSASVDGKFGIYMQTLSPSATATKAALAPRALLSDTSSPIDVRSANAVIEARAADAASTSPSSLPVACATDSTLTMTLNGTILTDSKSRTGYIASNRQFQFDGPPQAGAIYTAGFSACDDGAVALGGSKTFYQCLSGSFYNLFDQNIALQCGPVQFMMVKLQDCGSGTISARGMRRGIRGEAVMG